MTSNFSNWGFTREPPKQSAICRVCNQEIPKGQDAILLTTRYSDKYCRIFIHLDCFPEKSAIT
jgi:hypothetical protein